MCVNTTASALLCLITPRQITHPFGIWWTNILKTQNVKPINKYPSASRNGYHISLKKHPLSFTRPLGHTFSNIHLLFKEFPLFWASLLNRQRKFLRNNNISFKIVKKCCEMLSKSGDIYRILVVLL